MSDLLSELQEFPFELGKVLLKLELSKRESGRIIRALRGSETETIRLQKVGKYWNQRNPLDRPDGLVVVTNYRLVFLSKIKTILTTTEYLSFPYEFIENLEVTRVMLVSPAIRFKAEGWPYTFTFFANAGEVLKAVEEARADVKRKT